jgi:hypothetical protein
MAASGPERSAARPHSLTDERGLRPGWHRQYFYDYGNISQPRGRALGLSLCWIWALLDLGWPGLDRKEAPVLRFHEVFRGFAQSGSNPGHPCFCDRLNKAKALA